MVNFYVSTWLSLKLDDRLWNFSMPLLSDLSVSVLVWWSLGIVHLGTPGVFSWAKWRHKVKSWHCYLLENLEEVKHQGSFHRSVTFIQIYYNYFPRGVPNTDLFLLQLNHCNVAIVHFLKSKSNLKAPLTSFDSPLPTWWNSKFFTVWFHLLPDLTPYSVHVLLFHNPPNVCISSLHTM